MRWIHIVMLILPVAAAQGGVLADGGVSAPEVADVLKQAGYPADVSAGRAGDPLIRSSTGKVVFTVYFFQCGPELRCASIAFSAAYRHRGATPAMIAAWNRDNRFGRAFLDGHGTAEVSMDVETSHGMTTEALGANLSRWIAVLNAFVSSFSG
jgi:hypothetical protein